MDDDNDNTIICELAVVKGNVFFGVGNVLHPKAQVVAENGKIIFGSGNIISEFCKIVNLSKEPMIIGDNNVFGIQSTFHGSRVGSNCTMEAKSEAGIGSVFGDYVFVGPKCRVFEQHVVPDHTVFYGQYNETRKNSQSSEDQNILHAKHLEYLRQVLPKYHSLIDNTAHIQ